MELKPVLLIDFGSTNTKAAAVDLDTEQLLGTAAAYTTVETDIGEGLAEAMSKLELQTGFLEYTERYACSSAAGGLKMVSSGLVPDLTAKAAKLAALGAGAKVQKVYSYELTEGDAEEIEAIHPDIFLLTGGTDGGNRDNILQNAKVLAEIPADFPIVIAGNRSVSAECGRILREAGKQVILCENVMPRLGTLNIEPAQTKIREIFLQRIIHAKGLSKASQLIDGIMMPTPAAVLDAMKLLSVGTENEKGMGELIGIDVGGATTDIYSMTDGAPQRLNTVLKGLPEPYAKRTVEGDIGMRYSAAGIAEAAGTSKLCRLSRLEPGRLAELMEKITSETDTLPETEELERLDAALASMAVSIGVTRHAGTLEKIYTPCGEAYVQTGKDLTMADKIIVTGGALIHAERVKEIAAFGLSDMAEPSSLKPVQAEVFADKRYILSAMGLLSRRYPDTALRIMKKELISYGTAK